MQTNHKGLVYIKKRNFPEVLAALIFLFPFIMAFLLEFLKIPGFIKYTVDAMYICAFLFMYFRKNTLLKKKIAPFAIFALCFFLYCLIVYLFNFQSPFYFLWGVRNNFRFYISFLLFATVFNEDDIHGFLKFTDVIFWVNAAVTAFQFFVLGLRQDYLGGIFGVEKGCNAFTIIFLIIVVGKSLLLFMGKEQNAVKCFTKCGVSLLIAAMAELKFFFILFLVILIFSAVMTKFSFRKVVLLIVAAALLMGSSLLLPVFFGENRALTFENIIETITATNYSTAKDLGRFTAIPTISRNFLTGFFDKLFGMGLGNCDTSSFAICNSQFYRSHSYLNYNWFSSAFLFLETGYIGLFSYLMFYVICYFLARHHMKQGKANPLFCRMSMLMSLLCIVMVFYNSSLRTEAAYMSFFILAMPFAGVSDGETTGRPSVVA